MKSLRKKITVFVIALSLLQASTVGVFALPEGMNVESGSVTVDDSQLNTLTITSQTDQLILNWSDGFNIAENQVVYFNMPGSSSSVLNKDMSGQMSLIFGGLYSNGCVFIVNPNGIHMGPNATIDVGSLLASTLYISNQDFMNGNYVFAQFAENPGKILNEGRINVNGGGFLALLSNSVENTGVIQADMGTVIIASGKKMTLGFGRDGLIDVVVDEATDSKAEGVEDAILNKGVIQAGSGKVLIKVNAIKDLFLNAVNNQGMIVADNVVEDVDGTIVICANTGNICNTGAIEASGNIVIETAGTVEPGDIRVTGEGEIDIKENVPELLTVVVPQADVPEKEMDIDIPHVCDVIPDANAMLELKIPEFGSKEEMILNLQEIDVPVFEKKVDKDAPTLTQLITTDISRNEAILPGNGLNKLGADDIAAEREAVYNGHNAINESYNERDAVHFSIDMFSLSMRGPPLKKTDSFAFINCSEEVADNAIGVLVSTDANISHADLSTIRENLNKQNLHKLIVSGNSTDLEKGFVHSYGFVCPVVGIGGV